MSKGALEWVLQGEQGSAGMGAAGERVSQVLRLRAQDSHPHWQAWLESEGVSQCQWPQPVHPMEAGVIR